MIGALRELPATTYLRAVPLALVAAACIGIPADLIDTPLFGRPVPTRPIDYVIWIVSSALIGLVLAIRLPPAQYELEERSNLRAAWSGAVSFLAVGCPVCNQLVVALIGTGGALSWWAPAQPVVGAIAIGLILWALRSRLSTYQLTACPIPA